MEAGHVYALDYGYSFFITAFNIHLKIKHERQRDRAMSFRNARFMQDRDFRRYMRGG